MPSEKLRFKIPHNRKHLCYGPCTPLTKEAGRLVVAHEADPGTINLTRKDDDHDYAW